MVGEHNSWNFRSLSRDKSKTLQLEGFNLHSIPTQSRRVAILTVWLPKQILVTISCDIGLSPKQAIDQYKLSSLYGQCSNPSRTASRKRRSEQEPDETMSKITISNTINISSKNKKSNSSFVYSISVSLTVIMFFLF